MVRETFEIAMEAEEDEIKIIPRLCSIEYKKLHKIQS